MNQIWWTSKATKKFKSMLNKGKDIIIKLFGNQVANISVKDKTGEKGNGNKLSVSKTTASTSKGINSFHEEEIKIFSFNKLDLEAVEDSKHPS